MAQYRPPAYSSLPFVVKNLLIINVVCFVVFNLLQPQLASYLALHIWGAKDFAPYQFITHLFLHASLSHIFFNMFALWMFGQVLENVWGSKKFLTYYLFTGIGAALLYSVSSYWELMPLVQPIDQFLAQPNPKMLQDMLNNNIFEALSLCGNFPDQIVCPAKQSFLQNANNYIQNNNAAPLGSIIGYLYDYKAYSLNFRTAVGASGAIYGLIMAYAFIAPNQKLYFYGLIPIKAKYFALILGFVAFYMGMRNNPGDNIAHFAHLGGMVFGYILLKYWQYQQKI